MKYKFTDPVKGEIYEPVVVVPAVTLGDIAPFYFKNHHAASIDINLVANKTISYDHKQTANSKEKAAADTFSLFLSDYKLNKKDIVPFQFSLANLKDRVYRIIDGPDDNKPAKILKSINYNHIPYVNYFKDAVTKVSKLDLKIYGKRVGYIIGAGDKVPEALEQAGYEVTLLTDKELSRNSLQQFDAIISGVRAYNTNEWLNKYYDKLMKYVNDGGNLIVQYNTSNQIGPVKAKIGPYSFDISRTRITDETAPVTFLKPQHPVLNFPNKITHRRFQRLGAGT